MEPFGGASVPDLDENPFIEIDIIYYSQEDFEKIKVELLKMGYYHNGNQAKEDC